MRFFQFDRSLISFDERADAEQVERCLLSMQRAEEDFRSSLDLYNYAFRRKRGGSVPYESKRMVQWMKIAGRNGAIAANSFSQMTIIINGADLPSVRGEWNADAKKKARRLFQCEFPDILAIRASAAHPEELGTNPAERMKHRLKQPVSLSGVLQAAAGTFVSDHLSAYDSKLVYNATYNGVMVGYELSEPKADALSRAVDLYFNAFLPVGQEA
ncbi:hypothetical protein SAMN05192583_2122 [Sphingomonas gellani]|uniref:Uncharacterized protein n=1 Tax=Sphingomonas gellani TaxID=1166340 RepID=A0A1H8EDW8_9SPHN|nr:hypothetical protein [Sphingomonas gellani]SEN16948.1 hypothetical protein SAMN05192583_2122 [Sphingomonas gellani]